MLDMKEISISGFEKVIEAEDEEAGLHAFIALHNTSLGPALGGARIYPYSNPGDALTDVLRLARGMTYKSAVVSLGLGGGKSVIIANPKFQKTEKLLKAFGEVVNTLNGSYIVAEDLGSSTEDMIVIRK
ncbi:MAG TPA: Glu/Leu/Phe/Val dehydrogenase dimerization domain-containing protein, partial [Waddliaceae bacterium]